VKPVMQRNVVQCCYVSFLVVLIIVMVAGGVGTAQRETIRIWGLGSTRANQILVEEFNATHPDLELIMDTQAGGIAGQTIESMSKLLMAVAAGTPPGVTSVDRFVVGSVAARDILLPLDEFMERDDVDVSEWYPAVIQETMYKGKIYALPIDTDSRALLYNKDMFSESGIDPNAPPRTWDELYQVSPKLTRYNSQGDYEKVGIAPLDHQGWFYLWGWQNGGEFLSEDGRTAKLDDPCLIEALDYVVDLYDRVGGYDSVHGFFSRLGRDPFINQAVAMRIGINTCCLTNLATLIGGVEDFEWGVSPAPVPSERYMGKGRFAGKARFITWSGGWSWAIPKGVKNPNASWEVVKFLATTPGHLAQAKAEVAQAAAEGRPYKPPLTGHIASDQIIYEDYIKNLPGKLAEGYRVFIDLLPNTRYRPITPLASELWKAQAEAPVEAATHKAPPRSVLSQWNRWLQEKINNYYERGVLD